MLFRPSMLESDFGRSLPPETRCIFSRWEGYLDRPEWKETRAVLEAGGGSIIFAHTTGHIFKKDIETFVRRVQPKAVVPVHTFAAVEFKELFPATTLRDDGVPWTV